MPWPSGTRFEFEGAPFLRVPKPEKIAPCRGPSKLPTPHHFVWVGSAPMICAAQVCTMYMDDFPVRVTGPSRGPGPAPGQRCSIGLQTSLNQWRARSYTRPLVPDSDLSLSWHQVLQVCTGRAASGAGSADLLGYSYTCNGYSCTRSDEPVQA